VEAAHDGEEVGGAVADLLVEELVAEGGFGLLEDREGEAAQVANELGFGCGELVGGVDVVEEEAGAALLGVGLLANLSGDVEKGGGVEAGALGGGTRTSAGSVLVGTQQGGEHQCAQSLGQIGTAQRGQALGDAVGEGEERAGTGLDREEGALDGRLSHRIALTLRGMVGVELLESGANGLGHVRGTLVGDGLDAGAVVDGLGEDALDELCTLVVVDEDGVEEVAVPPADVLGGDELEGNAEGREIGGIGGELGAGDGQGEAEAWSARGASARRRRWGLGQWGAFRVALGGAGNPGTQGAWGEAEGVAEALLGQGGVLAVEP
jgi:hypothetical protein